MPNASPGASPGVSPATHSAAPRRCEVPLTRPLRHARYRDIWLANMVSNMGTWIQTFASAWLVASLSQSASITCYRKRAHKCAAFSSCPEPSS